MSIAATGTNESFSLPRTVASPIGTGSDFPKVGHTENGNPLPNVDSRKRPLNTTSSVPNNSTLPAKRPIPSHSRALPSDSNRGQKSSNEVPACLERLVRTIVRMFYSREHSLIVDMLVSHRMNSSLVHIFLTKTVATWDLSATPNWIEATSFASFTGCFLRSNRSKIWFSNKDFWTNW